MSLQLGRPVIEPVGESRSNTDVFMDLVGGWISPRDGDPEDDIDAMLASLAGLPGGDRRRAARALARDAALWRTAGAVCRRVAEDARTPRSTSARRPSTPRRRSASMATRPIRAPSAIRWRSSHRPARRTVSSMLGELTRPRRDASRSTRRTRRSRHIEDRRRRADIQRAGRGASCRRTVTPLVRPGTISMPKGVWRRHTVQRLDFERVGPGYPDRPRRRARVSMTRVLTWRRSKRRRTRRRLRKRLPAIGPDGGCR